MVSRHVIDKVHVHVVFYMYIHVHVSDCSCRVLSIRTENSLSQSPQTSEYV